MRVRCETNTWQPGGYYEEAPPDVVYEGEVVGAYYDRNWGQPMLMIWDEASGIFRAVDPDNCKPVSAVAAPGEAPPQC